MGWKTLLILIGSQKMIWTLRILQDDDAKDDGDDDDNDVDDDKIRKGKRRISLVPQSH